jgi:hypothetical protein
MTALTAHQSPAAHRLAAMRCTIDAARAAEGGQQRLAGALATLARRHEDLADAIAGVMRCGLDDLADERRDRIAS